MNLNDSQTSLDKSTRTLKKFHQDLINKKATDEYWEKKGGNKFWLGTYRLIASLGRGTYGIALLVEKKEKNGDRTLMVLKFIYDEINNDNPNDIFVYESDFEVEKKLSEDIFNEALKRLGLTPNIVYVYGTLILDFELFRTRYDFPKQSLWIKEFKQERDNIIKSAMIIRAENERRRAEAKKNRKSRYSTISAKIGIIELEIADVGKLSRTLKYISDNALYQKNEYPQVIKALIFGILSGLQGMNKVNFLHRDISGSNIVVTIKDTRPPKLGCNQTYFYIYGTNAYVIPEKYQQLAPLYIDYSLSNFVSKPSEKEIKAPLTAISYRAPEIIFITQNPVLYDHKSDIFSTAISIIDLLKGQTAYLTYTKDFSAEENIIFKQAYEEFKSNCKEYNEKAYKFVCK